MGSLNSKEPKFHGGNLWIFNLWTDETHTISLKPLLLTQEPSKATVRKYSPHIWINHPKLIQDGSIPSPMTSASKPVQMGNKVLKPFDGINQLKPTKDYQQPMKAHSCNKYQAFWVQVFPSITSEPCLLRRETSKIREIEVQWVEGQNGHFMST